MLATPAQDIEHAVRESQRRVEGGERDVEVAVATHVPMKRWGGSAFDHFPTLRFEARDVSDHANVFDLFRTRVQGEAHEAAVAEIARQLGNYAVDTGRMLRAGGGDMRLVTMGPPPRRIIRADSAIRPNVSSAGDYPVRARVLVEVESKHRSIPRADTFCHEYFDLIPQLRAVLLIKIFGRRVDRSFACLAILYRRDGGRIVAADTVSLGSALLDRSSVAALEDLGMVDTRHELFDQARPFMTIPAADVFADAVQLTPPPQQGFPDIRIDLRSMAASVSCVSSGLSAR